MLNTALKVLQKIEDEGFSAYIVGGFVRDYMLGIESSDIDICTNAKPKEIVEIFEGAVLPKEDYGSVIVSTKNCSFEITTFRTELEYLDNRHPEEIEYVDSLSEDLNRRDFTINTICMDKNGKIVDLLNAKEDLDNGIIRSVGSSYDRFNEDALRMLRAIRFATKLGFRLDDDVVTGIRENKELLHNISYERKKEELDKIFTCGDVKSGIELLINLGLDEVLGLRNLDKITCTESLIAIWSIIEVDEGTYPFTNNEKELIKSVRKALKVDILDSYNLYKYGLYACSTAGIIKGISREDVASEFEQLPIHSRKELDITSEEILSVLNIEPGPFVRKVYENLEKEVIYRRLENKKDKLVKYCMENFSSTI